MTFAQCSKANAFSDLRSAEVWCGTSAIIHRPGGPLMFRITAGGALFCGETRQQHVNEPPAQHLVLDLGEHFLELISDQQDMAALVAAAAVAEHVRQRQLPTLQPGSELSRI